MYIVKRKSSTGHGRMALTKYYIKRQIQSGIGSQELNISVIKFLT